MIPQHRHADQRSRVAILLTLALLGLLWLSHASGSVALIITLVVGYVVTLLLFDWLLRHQLDDD